MNKIYSYVKMNTSYNKNYKYERELKHEHYKKINAEQYYLIDPLLYYAYGYDLCVVYGRSFKRG